MSATANRGLDNYRRAEKRESFLVDIATTVERYGHCTVADDIHRFDDEPPHWIEEFCLRMHELETRGRDIEPPKTLRSELQKLCEKRGWGLYYDPINHCHEVVAQLREVDCEACGGRGWIMPCQSISVGWGNLGAVKWFTCDGCEGTGKVKKRI